MRKILVALGILALICSPAMAGRNANGALVVHVNDTIAYTATLVCGQYPTVCDQFVTQSDGPVGAYSVLWIMGAWLPAASPSITVVYFGVDIAWSDGLFAKWCGTGVTPIVGDFFPSQVPAENGISVAWPTAIAPATPGVNIIPIGVFRPMFDTPGQHICTTINPDGGYGAFIDENSVVDNITRFGCVRFGEPGFNDCPADLPVEGACCLLDGSCRVETQALCLAEPNFHNYVGDGTVCVPDNPCAADRKSVV